MFGLSQEADSVQNAAGLQGAGHDSLLLLPAVYNFRHYWTALSVIYWQLYTKKDLQNQFYAIIFLPSSYNYYICKAFKPRLIVATASVLPS